MCIRLTVIYAHADGAELLPNGVQYLGEAEPQLRFLTPKNAAQRPDTCPDEGCRTVNKHTRTFHSTFHASKCCAVAVPKIDIELIAERGAFRGLVFVDKTEF